MVEKTRIIDIYEKEGTFTSVFRKFKGFTGYGEENKEEYNTADLSILRHLLSNEKARLLSVVKNKKPNSIYKLSKYLERDFKSVREDVMMLKKFGFLELVEEKSNNRITHKPLITASVINIVVRI
ncbi:hypothetical protein J4205_02255 [Candidatus Pacearchaeota archaeon]|nr:hypothetical protein [Candidatus Pacearchaeota archaeon]